MIKTDNIHKAARLVYIVNKMLAGESIDTAALAARTGVVQRSIQRDIHDARRVIAMLDANPDGPVPAKR